MTNTTLPRKRRRLVSLLSGLLLILSTLSAKASAAPIRITGKVTDGPSGAALPGATVQVKGTTTGTVTDGNGTYSIQADDNATLVFSSIGFQKMEVAVGGRTTIDVSLLEDTKSLTEVVVVGYGTQRKIDVTGAVAQVKGEELVRQPVLSATQALQSKVAGVQIINSGAPGQAPVVIDPLISFSYLSLLDM